MADILLAMVDVLAEIFRFVISQRYLLLLAGLVWWFFLWLQTSLEEEERREKERKASQDESITTETSHHADGTSDLNADLEADSLDHKINSSHSVSGPYLMPLSPNVSTDSEPCKSQTISGSSSTFLKLRATFENASNPNNATSLPCLTVPRLNVNHSALSHNISNPAPGSPYMDNSYFNGTCIKSRGDVLRPSSPRSLGSSPAQSPGEERRSRNSKRLSVCGKCRTSGKSTSWSEADSPLRGRVKRTPDRDPSPATNVFYCSKYISVSNGRQVQIGDHCNMNTTAACAEEYDDSSTTDGESIMDHHDLDSNVVTDCDQDDPFACHSDDAVNSDMGCMSEDDVEDNEPLVCSFCRAKMTDDEKSELLPVADARRPVRSNTFPLGIPTADDNVLDTDIAHITVHCGTQRSASVSADGLTPPITDEEKERLYREAKVKIYEAARRHRELSSSSPNFERDDTERKSVRALTFWRRRKQSTDAKTKAS